LLLILLVESLWIFIISPRLTIGKIFLESDIDISDEKLLEILDLNDKTWTSLDEESVQKRLESYPMIREASVSRVFPDGLRVYIFRRRPLVVALFGEGGVSLVVLVDEEGYIIQTDSKTNSVDLPIISGIFPPTLGTRLPESMRQILSDLSRLKTDEAELFDLISEIEFLQHDGNGYDLKLYMNHIPVPVLIDMINPDSVRHALIVIDALERTSSEPIEIADIRGGHVTYKPAGGHDG